MENGVVDYLRDRAEEDLTDVLKTRMGGYTKESVHEYVNIIRKQQQTASQRFNEDMKSILAEKEKLTDEIARLQKSLETRDEQYRTISATLQEYKQTDGEDRAEIIADLKRRLVEQKSDMAELDAANKMIAQKNSQYEQEIVRLKNEVARHIHEHEVTRELLHDEKKSCQKYLEENHDLASELALVKDNLEFTKSQLGEGVIAELKATIDSLQNSIELQQAIVDKRNEELQVKEQQIETVKQQVEMHKTQLQLMEGKNSQLQYTINSLTEQNERLEAYQEELVAKLQEVFNDNLKIISEKSMANLQNMKLVKKLNDISNGVSCEKAVPEELVTAEDADSANENA